MPEQNSDLLAGIVGPTGSTVVLPKRFARDAVEPPFCGPVQAPRQLPFAFLYVGRARNTVCIGPVYVRVFITRDCDTVEGAFGIQRLPREPILWKFTT